MLQDLDRRQASPGVADNEATAQVRVVRAARKEREWFWRVVAALMVFAIVWVAWIGWQLQTRSLATPLAFSAAEKARAVPQAALPKDETRLPPKADSPPAALPALAPAETFKLARSIDTPIVEPLPRLASPAAQTAAPPPTPAPSAKAPAEPAVKLSPELPQARVLPTPSGPASRVDKRERTLTPAERAENTFRRAVGMLNQGRVPEAESEFIAALEQDASHEAARQALVALQLERGQLDAARKLLQEGLAINPSQLTFSLALARILVERRDYAGALETLQRTSGAGGNNADFQALRATALQRLGRHAEAADAYQGSLRLRPASPQTWVGLGVSFEALGKKPEAAEAFQRALASGPVGGELRNFAEQRIRALR